MRRFNYTNLWVYRNLSNHATWHQRSYQIASKQGNQNAQNNMITSFSVFRLVATCNSMVELSNSTGWDFDSTIKFNTSTGEDYCEWFVCGVCGTEVAFGIKQLSWLHSFLSFFSPRSARCSRQFTLNRSKFWPTLHWCWIHWEKKRSPDVRLDRYLGTFIRESAKLLT